MAKVEGVEFSNGLTCQGVNYTAPGDKLGLAEITIDGRYPEQDWARNRHSDEMVRVMRGTGRLAIRNSESTRLEAGDVTHIPAGEQFSWSGDMTLLVAFSKQRLPPEAELGTNDEEGLWTIDN